MSPKNISYTYNIHHLLPSSRKWSENSRNKVRFEKGQHAKFHAFFNHGIFPEQIIQLIRLSDRALNENIVQELFQILQKEPESFYRDKIITWGKIPGRTPNNVRVCKEYPKILHHILPISRGWTEHYNNGEKLSENTRRNFTGILGDTVFPEQILQLLLLSSSALEPVIVKEILDFMKYYKLVDFFKEEVLEHPWKVLPSIEKNLTQLHFYWNGSSQGNQKIKNKIFNVLRTMSKK